MTQRKNQKIHVKVMSTVIIWDILLILQIELNRNAVLKASKALENSLLLNIHVTFAVLTVLFYGLLVYSGRKMLTETRTPEVKSKHKKWGITAFILRTLTLITSFMMTLGQETTL